MNAILAALKTIIAPLEEYAEQKLESIGAAFLSAMAVIFNGFTNDQRAIGTKVAAYWQQKHDDLRAAGKSELEAVEEASTAALNEFFNEEGDEFRKIVSLTVTALEVSVANGIKR